MFDQDTAETLAEIERHIRALESGSVGFLRGMDGLMEDATEPYLDQLRTRRDELVDALTARTKARSR